MAVLNAPTPEPKPATPCGTVTMRMSAASQSCSFLTVAQSPASVAFHMRT